MNPLWFDVELDTVRLTPTQLTDWPREMAAPSSRMQEECLESIVALNLDLLFPGEDLLLVNTQQQMSAVADVIALDPLGTLRLIELKKDSVATDDLERQVIRYGIGGPAVTDWRRALAADLTYFPEYVAKAIEGVKSNERVKAVGKKVVKMAFPDIPWDGLDRFDQAHLLVRALRKRRGEGVPPKPLDDPQVRKICQRLYPIPLELLAQGEDPPAAVEHIVANRWGAGPRVDAIEFTIAAPALADPAQEQGVLEAALKERGVRFNVIDAELRHVKGNGGVTRAVLRWEPCRRATDVNAVRSLVAFRGQVMAANTEAGQFRVEFAKDGQIYLCFRGLVKEVWADVTWDEHGELYLATGANFLTQGLAELKEPRLEAVRALRKQLKVGGLRTWSKTGELAVPWQPADFGPAVELFVAYHRAMIEVGFTDPYLWQRRPASVRAAT